MLSAGILAKIAVNRTARKEIFFTGPIPDGIALGAEAG
jgi:hypothetical protein